MIRAQVVCRLKNNERKKGKSHLKPLEQFKHGLVRWRLQIFFWLASIVVGCASIFFAQLADTMSFLQKAWFAHFVLFYIVLAPLGVGLLVWLTEKFFPQASGSGIPQVIAALRLSTEDKHRLLAWPIALIKIGMTSIGLLLGLSIGREGPTIQVGATIMHAVGHWRHFPKHYMAKGLILAGGAAGLAAAFNTPLAGIVFAIEELSRSFEEKINGIVLSAVLFSGLTAVALIGNYYYFGQVKATLTFGSYYGWLLIPLIALGGGLLGGSFSACLLWGNRRLKPLRQAYPWRFGLAMGFVIVLLGLLSLGHTYGTGYAEAKALLGNPESAFVAYQANFFAPILKMMATLLSYWTGVPGGLFSPSLSAGAAFGASLARCFTAMPQESLALLGMTAYFVGVVQTPLTALVIITEMTHNDSMMLALMLTAILAQGASRLVCPKPIYQSLAEDFILGGKTSVAT